LVLAADLYTEIEECTTLPHAEMERQFKKLDAIWLAPFKEFLPRITANGNFPRSDYSRRKKVQWIFGRGLHVENFVV
jgi:hypothetical protein